MILSPHPEIKINKQTFGLEQAPILVVDNFVQSPEWLVAQAAQQHYVPHSPFYPGNSADTPEAYKHFFLNCLQDLIKEVFDVRSDLRFSGCRFSHVSTDPSALQLLQRIPHFDSLGKNDLAAVHYLFKEDLGGTSFYRHRKTGFEYIDESRKIEYFRSLEGENDGPNMPKATDGYINGDTALYERIAEQHGIFNRLVIYRRNSLHSGSIRNELFYGDKAISKRLTINSFIDCY